MTYYAYKQAIKNGATTTTNKNGSKKDMLYQYYLFCASSVKNEAGDDFDAVEFGTVEGGKQKREKFSPEEFVE